MEEDFNSAYELNGGVLTFPLLSLLLLNLQGRVLQARILWDRVPPVHGGDAQPGQYVHTPLLRR